MTRTIENLIAITSVTVALVALTISLLFFVIYVVARVKMFKQCGKEGWKAIVPFYATYVEYVEIDGLHWGWFLAWLFITLGSTQNTAIFALRIFMKAASFYNLAIRCRKQDPIPSAIFGALFPEITTMVYGFSNIDYDPTIEVKQSAIF